MIILDLNLIKNQDQNLNQNKKVIKNLLKIIVKQKYQQILQIQELKILVIIVKKLMNKKNRKISHTFNNNNKYLN